MFARLTRCFAFCFFVATAVTLAPLAIARAQSPAVGVQYFTPQTVATLQLNPQAIIQSPMFDHYPREIYGAMSLQEMGFDVTAITKLTAVVEPPLGSRMFYAVIAEFPESISLDGMSSAAMFQLAPREFEGVSYLGHRDPQGPCLCLFGDRVLVAASEPMLRKLLSRGAAKPTEPSEFLSRIAAHQEDNLYAAVNVAALRPLAQLALMSAQQEIPQEYQKFTAAVDYLTALEVAINLSGSRPSSGSLYANNPDDAQKLLDLVRDAESIGIAQLDTLKAKLADSEKVTERAGVAYIERMEEKYLPLKLPAPDGARLTLFDIAASDQSQNQNQMASIAVIGILVALLLPAVQAAREAARRNQAMHQMKQVSLALYNYHDTRGEFPAHAIYSASGKPVLSWRVAILPYFGEEELYKEFHLDEPWDSSHNLALVPRMPSIYVDPSSRHDPKLGRSNTVGVIGENKAFTGRPKGRNLRHLADGESKRIVIVQVNDELAPIWTQPDDWTPNAANPYIGLGGLHPGGAIVGYAFGHAGFVFDDIDPEQLCSLLTVDAGEPVNAP